MEMKMDKTTGVDRDGASARAAAKHRPVSKSLPATLEWRFPLPRTHTGILQGNGTTGLMIWGEGQTLRITIGRADFWDHRGGMPWTPRQNYRDIRRLLEANDEPGLRALFQTATQDRPGQPARPSVIPLGRLEVDLGAGALLTRGELQVRDGLVTICYRRGTKEHRLRMELSMTEQAGCLEFDGPDECAALRAVTSWHYLGETFRAMSLPASVMLEGDWGGWAQPLPVDPALCVAWRRKGNLVWLADARGADAQSAIVAAKALAGRLAKAGPAALHRANVAWWKGYWRDVPVIKIPNERLQSLYEYGMYKFAGLSQPGGVAASLQGPWIEEYQMPPWSSDYHFNINVQMCYWPAYKGNRLGHLMPLFNMISSWEPQLRANAKAFLGIDDGLMLPHAVDDRCVCMGNFWTGCIDHGSTAWVAQMMYDYAMFTGDTAFLRDRAYPFMVGAMRVYEAMLERDGEAYRLPVSVSPEYRSDGMNAWGVNASFQLACIHRLCENLVAAAAQLGQAERPIWRDILARLPKADVEERDGWHMIGLWKGVVLEETHRHHSHLSGICPFDVIDLDDPAWKPIVARSLHQWVYRGMGLWTGWCMPWASMIHSRMGNGQMAELLLEIWERVFTNSGRGTLVDFDFPGFTLMGGPLSLGDGVRRGEIMQIDAGMGAVAAIQDMLMHTRRGVVHVFPGVPARWHDVELGPMPCEFGCRISARRKDDRLVEVGIQADRDTVLRLANPFGQGCHLAGALQGDQNAPVLELTLKAGEKVVLTPGGS
jgi:hypothetical protein